MGEKAEVTFTQDYAVYKPKPQHAYPLTEGDLDRLEILIGRITPYRRVWLALASIIAGVCGSAFFSLLALSTLRELANWIWTTNLVVLFTSLILTVVFFIQDRQQKNAIEGSVTDVLSEIKFIKQRYHIPEDAESSSELVAVAKYVESKEIETSPTAPSQEIARAWRDAVINPLLYKLLGEQRLLEKGSLVWDRYGKRVKDITYISDHSRYSGLEEEFYGLHVDVQEGMDKHDQLVADVNARTEALFKVIAASDHLAKVYEEATSHESLEKIRNNFMLELERYETDEDIINEMLGRSTSQEKRFEMLAEYIVNGIDELPNNYTTRPLWNMYGSKFLNILNLPLINTYHKQSNQAREALRRLDDALIAQIKKIRYNLSRQHGIPVEEPSGDRW